MQALDVRSDSLWTFSSDIAERRRLFHADAFEHPAKLNLRLLRKIVDTYTRFDDVLLDPMAGSGSLMLAAYLLRNVILRELEPAYVGIMQKSVSVLQSEAGLFCGQIDIAQADARTLAGVRCNHIITSPPYGFETGKGVTKERLERLETMGAAWRNKVRGKSSAAWTGGMQYEGGRNNVGNKSGRSYWREMHLIYERCADLLPPGGLLILILKDHYRRGRRIPVVDQTVQVVTGLGLPLIARHGRYIDKPSIWQRRRKEKGLPIVEIEDVLVFTKGGHDGATTPDDMQN
jgi:DNA methylase